MYFCTNVSNVVLSKTFLAKLKPITEGNMKIVYLVLDFFVKYDYVLLPLLLIGVGIFAVANWLVNVYAKQNRKFVHCRKQIVADSTHLAKHVRNLPSEYRRQYRAYVNSGAELPGQTFEFVPLRNKLVLIRFFVLLAVLTGIYIVAYGFGKVDGWYLLYVVSFWLAFVVALLINRGIFVCQQKHARRIFGEFVATLNKYVAMAQQPTQTTLQQLNTLKREPCCDETLSRCVELLRDNLAEDRPVEEQRQVNRALNSLLQSYAKAKRT